MDAKPAMVYSPHKKLLFPLFLLLLPFLFTEPCFAFITRGISGRVIDADTGQPIEGAIGLCVWTKKNYLGIEVITDVVRVQEFVSEKTGHIRLAGHWGLFLDPPELIIYKRGYRAWNNHEVFPAGKARTDFVWENGFVARLERWKNEDTFNKHEEFVAIHTVGARTEAFAEAMDWERLEQARENDRINERRRSPK